MKYLVANRDTEEVYGSVDADSLEDAKRVYAMKIGMENLSEISKTTNGRLSESDFLFFAEASKAQSAITLAVYEEGMTHDHYYIITSSRTTRNLLLYVGVRRESGSLYIDEVSRITATKFSVIDPSELSDSIIKAVNDYRSGQ